MRHTLERAIVLSVMEASVTGGEHKPFYVAGSEQESLDTSTWEQMIRVLGESEESERRAWFSARKHHSDVA